MSQQNRTTNKGRFENGDRPSGTDYIDLIDSFLSLADSTAQTITSDIAAPKMIATTEVSSPQVNTTEVSASTGHFTTVTASNIAASGADFTSVSAANLRAAAVSASTMNVNFIDGPVQVGPAGTRGRLLLVQQAEISGNNTKKTITLPGGSDILDIKYIPRSPLSTSAASTVDILVGTSADDAKLARFLNVSGMAYRTLANDVDVSGLASVSGAPAILIIGATAASGAIASAGRGVLSVVYVQKQ